MSELTHLGISRGVKDLNLSLHDFEELFSSANLFVENIIHIMKSIHHEFVKKLGQKFENFAQKDS